MARIRSLHPGQWTDAKFVRCSPLARLLALALRNEADDQGVFVWEPMDLKIRYLAADNADVDALLAELEAHEQVRKYEVNGRHYGAVRNFTRYQRPKFPKFIHPITDDIRSYVASTHAATVEDEDDDDAFPRKGEKGLQRKEEGGRREKKEKASNDASGVAPSARQPAAHLPADWKPDDKLRAYAAKLGLNPGDIEREIVKFVGWFVDGGGSEKRRNPKGWRQSWQGWVGRAAKDLPPAPRANGEAPKPGTAEWYALHPEAKPTW